MLVFAFHHVHSSGLYPFVLCSGTPYSYTVEVSAPILFCTGPLIVSTLILSRYCVFFVSRFKETNCDLNQFSESAFKTVTLGVKVARRPSTALEH